MKKRSTYICSLLIIGLLLMASPIGQAMELVDVQKFDFYATKSKSNIHTTRVNIDGTVLEVTVDYTARPLVVRVREPGGKYIVNQASTYRGSDIGVSLKKLVFSNPSKSFLVVKSDLQASSGYTADIWIIGQYNTGAWTAFFKPETLKNISIYGTSIGLANENGVLALDGQTRHSFRGQYMLPWDEEAYWFGIGKTEYPEYNAKPVF